MSCPWATLQSKHTKCKGPFSSSSRSHTHSQLTWESTLAQRREGRTCLGPGAHSQGRRLGARVLCEALCRTGNGDPASLSVGTPSRASSWAAGTVELKHTALGLISSSHTRAVTHSPPGLSKMLKAPLQGERIMPGGSRTCRKLFCVLPMGKSAPQPPGDPAAASQGPPVITCL